MLIDRIRYCTLFSGSSGNCAYIESPGAKVLIDCGWCAAAIKKKLREIGSSVESVDAIFVTHEHGDHIDALDVLEKKNPIPIHILYASACVFRYAPEHVCRSLVMYRDAGQTATVGDMKITSFPLSHDTASCVGYRIDISDGLTGETVSLGYCTDTGFVSQAAFDALRGCYAVILESNHDDQMLADCEYSPALKQRIFAGTGHLSNLQCAKVAQALARTGTEKFLLAHLSEHANTPDVALNETLSALRQLPDGENRTEVRVASRKDTTFIMGR